MNSAEATTAHEQHGELAARELVIAYAKKLPAQLEHWIDKRGMSLEQSASGTIDGAEIATKNARYVVVDLDTQPNDALGTLRALRESAGAVRIIAITARSDEAYHRDLIADGVAAIVVKQPYVADLVLALESVGEGKSFVSGMTSGPAAGVQITERERQVLDLMVSGHTNQRIADRLDISVKTVEAHRAHLFKKLGASNAADAVLLAIRAGLVMP
jgi:DNA-binding NarL/FixJ family response regulator